jgi:hypothetical protein
MIVFIYKWLIKNTVFRRLARTNSYVREQLSPEATLSRTQSALVRIFGKMTGEAPTNCTRVLCLPACLPASPTAVR